MEKELKLIEEMISISKELFEYNKDKEGADNFKEHIRLWESTKSFLIELKTIKESKPNKALESIIQAFDHTLEVSNKARLVFNEKPVSVDWNELAEIKIIKQALLKAEGNEKENAEYKKVLEIIKNIIKFGDDLNAILNFDTYEEYNEWSWDYELTKDEFNTLKRWLKDEKSI